MAQNNLVSFFLPNYCHSCYKETDGLLCSDCSSQIIPIRNYCPKCGKPLDSEVLPRCTREICAMAREIGYFFDYARSAVYLNTVAKKIIHRFKYRGRLKLLKVFIPYLNQLLDEITEKEHFNYIIAVPMYFLKRWRRGYNQSLIITKYIAEYTGIRIVKGLHRKKYTKMQAQMSLRERAKNMSGAIKINNKIDFYEKNVLLVDDVMTTGYTVNECAKILRRAGTHKIVIITLARH